jgi:tetratricopeptide (TPR) repeat protein
MAKIPLRTYDHEIEKLIDQAHTDEAIAHCQYILQTFPKRVETYRLLGKAYLERQQYGEAADLFLRVLSVLPDDFVAHIGMSIIREDEGNLDAAIWHMERAYESQSANAAVQEELRRLYGRRDGVEPPRVRLTRGALARMYARGELHHQALAEIKAALSEDPNRLDLRTIQARMLFQSGQKAEATEICSSLLAKYPYCLEANRLLAEILPGTSRAADAKIYQQRLMALDPYLAYTSPTTPDVDDVPDNAVLINRLDYEPNYSAMGQSQPQWAESLGINLGAAELTEQGLPDWMTAPPQSPFFPDNSENLTAGATNEILGTQYQEKPETSEAALDSTPESTSELPDFLKNIGWTSSTGTVDESQLMNGIESETEEAEGLAPAEIPEWLKSLAPEEDISPEGNDNAVDQDLARLLGGTEDTSIQDSAAAKMPEAPIEETAPVFETKQLQPEETPDWLQQLATQPSEDTGAKTPDWLGSLGTETEPESETPTSDDTLPDWLRSTETPATSAESFPAASAAETTGENIPDWLQGLTAAPETSSQSSDNLPEWLRGGEETPTPSTEAVAEKPEPAENSSESVPDWLQQLTTTPEPSVQPTAQPSSELPEWLRGTEVPAPPSIAPVENIPVPSATSDENAPEWLQNLTTDNEPLSQPSEGLPEWLQGAGDVPAQAREEIATPSEAEPAVENTPDWLQDLKAVSETTVQPSDELPEWLQGAGEAPAPAPEEIAAPSEAIPADENTPDWLQDLKAASEATVQPSEELPEWLRGTEETSVPVREEIGSPFEPVSTVENAPDSLPDTTASEAIVQSSEELPEWLRSMDGEAPLSTPQEEAIESPSAEAHEPPVQETSIPAETVSETDAALAWLENLAAKHGADEETLYVPPEQRTETPPDWVSKSVEPQTSEEFTTSENEQILPVVPPQEESVTSVPEAEPSPAEPVADLPDWLQEIRKPDQSEVPAVEIEPDQIPAPSSKSTEMDEAAALAWLEGLAAKHGADEETLYVPPEQRTETPPEWVSASMETGEMEAEVKAPDIEAQSEASSTPETQALPDWLQEISQPEESVEPVAGVDSSSAVSSSASAEMDEAAALAWLEGLAAKHGADEETLYVPPEQRTETPPEWVSAAVETEKIEQVNPQNKLPAAEEIGSSGEEIPTETPEQTSPELPEWLSEFTPVANAVETPAAEEALPEWLTTAEDAPVTPVEVSAISTAPEELEAAVGISEVTSTVEESVSTPAAETEPVDDTQPIRQAVAPIPEVVPVIPIETAPAPVASAEPADPLRKAHELLEKGNIEPAIEIYNTLIRQSIQMETVIHDLRDAQYRYPVDISILQALGDAYVRVNRIQDALDAYTKAEELIR